MKPFFLLLAAVSLSAPLGAAESAALKTLLTRPIIGPQLALAEVENYTEARVPLVPAAKTAAEWDRLAARWRQDVLEQVVYRGAARQWRDYAAKVEWFDTIEGGPGYKIRKLRFEVLPGLVIPALLYLPDQLTGKFPVHLAVNGHDGNGKQSPYKQIRCANLARRGIVSLNLEWFAMGQLRTPGFAHTTMNQLDLCGSSGIAPFHLAMRRGLDILLALPNADPARCAVSGLSGGGWQTIFISSLDPRVTLCNPVAGYSSFRTRVRNHSDLGDSEQTPSDLASVADYAHLTAMLAPRAALLTYNAKDNCCFASGHALAPLLEAAAPAYALHRASAQLRSHINTDPGTHNYDQDNREAFYRIVGDTFFPGDKQWNAAEIPVAAEVKTKEQLHVELPAVNLDFNQLALALAKDLPRNSHLHSAPAAFARWQTENRKLLRQLVRAKDFSVTAERAGMEELDGTKAIFWRLKLGANWTVPAVELTRGAATDTVIVVADGGRKSAAAEVEVLLAAGKRVLAVDPFYFGESAIVAKDWLFALMVATVGDRPLGLQASQLGAVARWAQREHPGAPARVLALGPRSSLYALVAAGLEEKTIGGLELRGGLGSLKEVLTKNVQVSTAPEQFCFGLLESFDIPQLEALVAPRPVTGVKAGN